MSKARKKCLRGSDVESFDEIRFFHHQNSSRNVFRKGVVHSHEFPHVAFQFNYGNSDGSEKRRGISNCVVVLDNELPETAC